MYFCCQIPNLRRCKYFHRSSVHLSRSNSFISASIERQLTVPLNPNTSEVASPKSEEILLEFKQDMKRIGYWSVACFSCYMLILVGIGCVVIGSLILRWTRINISRLSSASPDSISVASGSCDSLVLQAYSNLAHIGLSALGAVISALSSYLQQICTSPSCADIAERVRIDEDMSFGSNLPKRFFIGERKQLLALLWILLVLTSLPVQLALNATTSYRVQVLGTPAINAIRVADVDRDQYVRVPFSVNGTVGDGAVAWSTIKSWTNVSGSQCADLIHEQISFVTDYRNVIAVVDANSSLNTRPGIWSPLGDPALSVDYAAWFTTRCSSIEMLGSATPGDFTSCYVETVSSLCQLTVHWFPPLVIGCVLIIKGMTMLLALRMHFHFKERLVNCLGDVIVLATKYNNVHSDRIKPSTIYGKQWIFWWRRLGKFDYLAFLLWWASVGIAIGIGRSKMEKLRNSVAFSLTRDGLNVMLGRVDTFTFIHSLPQSFPVVLLIANSPQLWISVCLLIWNTQISQMWMEREWRSYYLRQHLPRVSFDSKEPGTRPTRWLQLPYWLAVLLGTVSVGLHWVTSQTLNVIETVKPDGSRSIVLNYSPLAILCTGLASMVLVVILSLLCIVPIRSWMPLMGGSARVVWSYCSHLPSKLPSTGIAWGDISTPTERRAGFGEEVGPMVPRVRYPNSVKVLPRSRWI